MSNCKFCLKCVLYEIIFIGRKKVVTTATTKIEFGRKKVVTTATTKIEGLKSYIGVVFLVSVKDYETTIATVCETVNPSKIPPEIPTLLGSKIQCAPGSVNLSNY